MPGSNKRIVKKSSSDVSDVSNVSNKTEQKLNVVASVSEPVIINKVVDSDKAKNRPKRENKKIIQAIEIEIESSENKTTSTHSQPTTTTAAPAPTTVSETVTNVDASQTKKNLIPNELEKELKFKESLNVFRTEITNYSKQLKEMKLHLKKLELAYDHDIAKSLKMRPKNKRRNADDPTGFIKQIALSKELAELIGEQEKTMMSMPEYTKKFFKMMKEQKLLYEGDGRVFRANDRIKKVFSLPDKVNESTNYRDKEGFNLYNLQTYISKVNDPVAYEKKHTQNVQNA
jgi:hypothetical protein